MTLREWLADEPFTLVLSSGFFSFFAHGGVLAALSEEGLLPRAVAGSSAGALTGGLWASGLETREIHRLYTSLDKKDFWDPAPGPGLLKGRRFRQLVRSVIPVQRVEHCRRPLSVSAFDLLRLRTRVLRSGDLARSLYASCAVPGLFHPLWHEGGLLVDGGVMDGSGLHGVPAGRRILCHDVRSGPDGSPEAPPLSCRNNLVILRVPHLPRPGPNRMQLGKAAWAVARRETLRALGHLVIERHEAPATRGAKLPAAGRRA